MGIDKDENIARRTRILDAAADLIVHYGYDKTTVSDIAREAGVSKGAIYLHFNSKDDLFEALLMREMAAYTHKWIELIEADPRGGTLGGMYKNVLYALNSNVFMAAMFKQDAHVLGSYLRKPDNLFRQGQRRGARFAFVQMMQQAGAMRDDMPAAIIAHIMNMLAYGLVAMDDVMDPEDIPATDALIEGIADMMDRAFTPQDGGNMEAGKAVVRQIAEATRLLTEQETPDNKEE